MTMIGWEYFTQAEVDYRKERAHRSWPAVRKARKGRTTRRWLGSRRGADDLR